MMESSKSETNPPSTSSMAVATRVAHVMKMDPPYCTPDDTLRTAARLMTACGGAFLPVVEPQHNGQLIGAVTASVVAEGAQNAQNGTETPVSEVMTLDPLCCSIDDDLETIRELMSERGVSAAPVVDDWGCCIGIVTGDELQSGITTDVPVISTSSVAPRAKARRRSASSSSSVSSDRDELRL